MQKSMSGNYINILLHYSASELQCQGMHTHTHTHTHTQFPRQYQSKCFVSICLLSVFVYICGLMQRACEVHLKTHFVSMKLKLTSESYSSSVFMCQLTKT